MAQTPITRLSQITDMNGSYKLAGNITATTGVNGTFKGTFDGDMYTISGLTTPLFNTVNGATVRNVMLDNVQISNHSGATGAIAGTANGASRIYNCGVLDSASRIGGTGYTGSIVGQLNNTSRVINCFSYATITGGSTVAGIVGDNDNTSTSINIQTLIVNCMFYGDITGGTTAYPIYGGPNKISNQNRYLNRAINNYNYFRQEATMNNLENDYNCALAAEERFLRRWEFYRGILNSNRALMAYYISGNKNDTALVAKWVQADGYPYPILKKWGRYPSQINSPYVLDHTARPAVTYDYGIDYDIDYNNTEQVAALNSKLATHFCGGSLGTIRITVNRGEHGSGVASKTIELPITDMDTHTLANHYDYCFRKVQLPYYNDLFEGNYGQYVVTGWDISTVTGNSTNTYTTADNASGYNFADTLDAGKDKYNVSGRVFAQGGYYYVPQGVTEITITAHWANAVYVSDPYYDVVYNTSYTASNFTAAGLRPWFTSANANGSFNGQTVYRTLANAVAQVPTGDTVYDHAIVLVGNVHQFADGSAVMNNGNRPFTIMSIDGDKDNEPDYCLFYQHTDRKVTNPIRFDFLWQPGIGIAAKVDGDSKMPDVGIFYPKGHFEITETAVAHYYEFEYDYNDKNSSPLILNNGIFEQFVSTQNNTPSHTTYIILGGHVWMKEFNNGTHADGSEFTPHHPISVMGGEYPKFYLSGIFRPDATANNDNAECYINGGKFGEIAGAGQEQIKGDITFKINHAIIDEFYGGGINKQKPITGNINVTINHSVVNKYCGAAKFGNMAANKTVTTNAYGTVFGTYFGAGNGGTSIYRARNFNGVDHNVTDNTNHFPTWMNNDYRRGNYNANYGIVVGYEFEYFVWAGGSSTDKVSRFYAHYASFDIAQTHNVFSTLNKCLIKGNYYGGGNLGAVDGTATTMLDNTIVLGDAYAAGFSASIPTADVYPPLTDGTNGSFPKFEANTGLFKAAVLPTPTKYTWSNDGSYSPALNDNERLIHTNSDLTTLSKVNNNAIITVKGDSRIYGNLYGGGAMSEVLGNTAVNVMGNAKIDKNVYGGGNAGVVHGSTHVQVGGNEWTTP